MHSGVVQVIKKGNYIFLKNRLSFVHACLPFYNIILDVLHVKQYLISPRVLLVYCYHVLYSNRLRVCQILLNVIPVPCRLHMLVLLCASHTTLSFSGKVLFPWVSQPCAFYYTRKGPVLKSYCIYGFLSGGRYIHTSTLFAFMLYTCVTNTCTVRSVYHKCY